MELFSLLFASYQEFDDIIATLATLHVMDGGQRLSIGHRVNLGALNREDLKGVWCRLIGEITGRILQTSRTFCMVISRALPPFTGIL